MKSQYLKVVNTLSVALFSCAFISFITSSISYADEFNFSGYLKSYALVQDELVIDYGTTLNNSLETSLNDPFNNDQNIASNFQSQNALRLMSSYLSPTRGNIEFHYEVQPLYFSNTDFASLYQNNGSNSLTATFTQANNQYRFADLDPVLSEVNDNTVILQNLDRLNYQYSNQYGDLTIGRQVISFGSSRFINPTDIFIPFAIQTLNQEYRVGIDAVRYKADIGDFAVLDVGVIVGEDIKKENSAAFIRGKNSIKGNDIEVIFIALDQAWLIGTGIERAIGDFGFWFETAYMDWHQTEGGGDDDSDIENKSELIAFNNDEDLAAVSSEVPYTENYWRTSIGSDYAINSELIVMFEYHYNGAGSKTPDEYKTLSAQAPYQNAGVYLLGKNYIIPAITWLASPLISVNASAFYNVYDKSIFFNLSSETSWSDNLYSDFGVYLSSGDHIKIESTSANESALANDNIINGTSLTFGSEFGSYPLSIYASLRYYF